MQQILSEHADSKFDRALAKRSPLDLAAYASPYIYETPPHLKLLNKLLMSAMEEPNRRYVVSMPPRHGKSELTSLYFPAWATAKYPGTQIMLIAYEATFAAEWGGKARDVIGEFGQGLFGVYGDRENWARNNWRCGKPKPKSMTGKGHVGSNEFAHSYMRTAGVNGPITGKGADVLLIDDPIKNPVDIATPESRDRMWDWWHSTAYSRLMKNASVIVVATRWHEDDLSGRLLQQAEDGEDSWVGINLPAFAEDNDPLGRAPGEALWPQMFDEVALQRMKDSKPPYWWTAMYQGRPTPMDGGILKREWMKHRYHQPPPLHRTVQSIDAAFKTGVGNDYSVIATWGTDAIDYYLLDVWRARVEFPDLKQAISDQYHKWNPSGVYIEDAAAGQSIIQEMGRQTMIPVIGKPIWGNDISRAHAVSGIFQAGKVKLPLRAPWLAEWIEEHIAFPNAAHDDQVATTYYALEELAYAGLPIMEFV